MTLTLTKPIVYVTRDIERALGVEPLAGYFVVSNASKYAIEIKAKYPENVFLVKSEKKALDTYDILSLPETQEIIDRLKADVVVFQNTSRIERLAKEKGWNLLNPSASLSKEVEEKISQVEWLGEDADLLPPHKIAKLKDFPFGKKKVVLQFNHAHTGHGTYVIEEEKTLSNLREKFPDRECRVTDFIDGPVFTVNAVSGEETLVGNPSYQITGLSPFTDLPFSTIGNDFALPLVKRYEKARRDISAIATKIGERLAKSGWKGLFGIDVIYDEKAGKTYLLEINARQPASSVFESKLESMAGGATIFEAHLKALLGVKPIENISEISDGAQIVKRVTREPHVVDTECLNQKGFDVIEYESEDLHNKELFRIQSTKGIMESHEKLNQTGKFIASCIK